MEIKEQIYYTILSGGAIMGITRFRRSSTAAKWLTVLFVCIIVKEICAKIIAAQFGTNLGFYRITGIIDFAITTLVFLSIPALRAVRKIVYVLAVAVLCFYLITIIKWELPKGKADTYFKLVRNFILVCYALLLMMRLYQLADEESIFRKSSFWVASGVLFFYCFSILYWGCFNYYVGKNQAIMTEILRPMFTFSNYVLYTCLAVALYLNNFNNRLTYVG